MNAVGGRRSAGAQKAAQYVKHRITDYEKPLEVNAEEHTQKKPGTNPHPVQRKPLAHTMAGNGFCLNVCHERFRGRLRC